MIPLRKIVKENNACSLPWLMAEIQLQNDIVNPCCKYYGNLGSLNENSFPVIWHNNFDKVRQSFITGTPLPECSACHISKDIFSYKEQKNKDFEHLLNVDINKVELPKIFHISLKNVCNLACRMCDTMYSSKLDNFISKSPELKKYYSISSASNHFDISKLAGSFSNATYVTFVGGEPLVDTDCVEILKLIVSESKHLKYINFITNMTKLNLELLDLVSSLNAEICLTVSVDGPPALQEYIRHFSKWDQIKSNMEYIRSRYPKIKFAFNSTISIMNVGYVPDTIRFLHKLEIDLNTKFKYCLPAVVLGKRFLFPGNLPQKVKDQYLEKLNNYQGPLTIKGTDNLLSSAIGLLNESQKSDFAEFVEFISEFDKLAGTDYKIMYPEFWC